MTDINGKVILSKEYNEAQLLNMKIDEPTGVYFLIIESDHNKAIIRLIKQ